LHVTIWYCILYLEQILLFTPGKAAIMRLGWTQNKTSVTYRAVKTIRVNGKNKTLPIKTFGTDKHICETYGVTDAKAWAKEQVRLMNEKEAEESATFSINLCAAQDLPLDQQNCFNGGYLFLQEIYYELGLDRICRAIALRHRFSYNLNSILARLIYTRILYPSSKKSALEESKRFIEQPSFELHDIYRALSIIAEESDYIQSRLFQNSCRISSRKTAVIYYDCTNFYFEIEKAEEDKQYGVSKENRPLPIVEMGLFMDQEGIPLAFDISAGNTSEQSTLIPLEKKLMDRFDLSKFVICTDSGLSSATNRYFNSPEMTASGNRAFITTQSVKKLKSFLKDWALDPAGWSLSGSPDDKHLYNLNDLDEEKDYERIYYKSRWIKEPGDVIIDGKKQKKEIEQQLIVSYSIKYRKYLRAIRDSQIERAQKIVNNGEKAVSKRSQNDPKRLIHTNHATKEGEAAEQSESFVDPRIIEEEEKYDGYYAVCTNLSDHPRDIVKVNQRRWEIEECFRIMKTDFRARPVYVKRKERILAHFITCFIALIIYRYLEKKLGGKYTIGQILPVLRNMNFMKYEGKGYQPTYTRTELTDALHEVFGFCTSRQIVPVKTMKNICARTKKTEK
jgi:transposase